MVRAKDPSKLSRKPHQIRNRLRRSGGRIEEDMRMYLEVVYQKPIEKWDLEELARGRPRDKNGEFRGRTPSWVSAAIQKEARRRLVNHAFGSLTTHVDFAVQTVINLIKSDEVDERGRPLVDAKTKLQACMFIIEHVIGKPKATIELTQDQKQSAIAAAIILDDGEEQDEPVVLEGEWQEDDEDADQ